MKLLYWIVALVAVTQALSYNGEFRAIDTIQIRQADSNAIPEESEEESGSDEVLQDDSSNSWNLQMTLIDESSFWMFDRFSPIKSEK